MALLQSTSVANNITGTGTQFLNVGGKSNGTFMSDSTLSVAPYAFQGYNGSGFGVYRNDDSSETYNFMRTISPGGEISEILASKIGTEPYFSIRNRAAEEVRIDFAGLGSATSTKWVSYLPGITVGSLVTIPTIIRGRVGITNAEQNVSSTYPVSLNAWVNATCAIESDSPTVSNDMFARVINFNGTTINLRSEFNGGQLGAMTNIAITYCVIGFIQVSASI